MKDIVKLNDGITIGPQPTAEELPQLQELGFKSIVNFRTEGEDEQPLSPQAEGDEVERLGLDYFHAPISMKVITPITVDQFRMELANLPKPVYVHCKAGRRAALMAMMHIASEAREDGEKALRVVEEMGFKPEKATTEKFFIDYVDRHSKTVPR